MTCSFVVLATTQDLQSPLAPRTMCQGYVVNNEGDTAQGWIKFMTVIANQFNVVYTKMNLMIHRLANISPRI